MEDRRLEEIQLPGGRANAKSVIEENRVALLDGVLDEIVLFGFFGGVPIAGFMVRGNLAMTRAILWKTSCHMSGRELPIVPFLLSCLPF